MKSELSVTSESVELTKEAFYQLLSFFATGAVEDDSLKTIKGQNLTPVHYLDWMEKNSAVNPYPVCFLKDDNTQIAVSLDTLFSNLKEKSSGADQIQSERILNELKQHIKTHLNGFSEAYLYKIWDKSTKSLLESYKKEGGNPQDDVIEKIIHSARKSLNIDGDVVTISPRTPMLYLNRILEKTWRQKSMSFVTELDWLILQLRGFLEANQLKTSSGKSAGSLKGTMGETYDEDFDFDVLSDMLQQAFSEDVLPEIRYQRIEQSLKSLKEFRRYYPAIINDKITRPLVFEQDNESIKKIKSRLKKYQSQLLEFYKAVHIARLEVNNNYIEARHDAFFREFHFSFLSQEDLNSIPPFPVYLNSSDIKNFSFEELTEIMEVNLPVKLLFVVDDVIDFKNSDKQVIKTNKWSRKLASMAINVANAYIFKSTLLKVPQLEKELLDGFNYNGPALFCIYTHNNENFSSPNSAIPYQALVNSRAFPLWTFVPSGGHEIARQFNVQENPSPREDWSNEVCLETPFTIIDFLASYKGLAEHFLMLPFKKSHADLIPFYEYRKLDDKTAKNKLPYALMADTDGLVYKILPDYAVIKATDNFIGNWLTLQELASVHSVSPDEVQPAAAAEERVTEPDKAVSREELSKEIISTILARLVNGDLQPKPANSNAGIDVRTDTAETLVIKEAPSAEKTADEPASPAEQPQKIDEPYIETVLCTSCNECININSMMFAYNEDKQAEIVDPGKGTFKQLVMAAEKCPAAIIHPGKPRNPDEKDLDKLIKRAEKFN